MVTFEEFEKTVYYTEKSVVVPLLNVRLPKIDFIKNNKYKPELVKNKLLELYEKNIEKFK